MDIVKLLTWARFWHTSCTRAIITPWTQKLQRGTFRTIRPGLTRYSLHVEGIIRTVITRGTQVTLLPVPRPRRLTTASSCTVIWTELTGTKMADETLAIVVVHHGCVVTPMTSRAWEAVTQIYAAWNVTVSVHRTINWSLAVRAVLSRRTGYSIGCSYVQQIFMSDETALRFVSQRAVRVAFN